MFGRFVFGYDLKESRNVGKSWILTIEGEVNGRGNRNGWVLVNSRKKTDLEPVRPWSFLLGELPLQNTTTVFILINTLDIFMTYVLMRNGAIEANPVANYFMHRWGFVGLISFKLFVVAAVCVIAQVVALKKLKMARWLLVFGSTLVGLVVVYGVSLYARHFVEIPV